MPHRPTVPPSDRFFARLDKFDCACPNCGRIIVTSMDRRTHWARMLDKRRPSRLSPKSRKLWDSVWNPIAQRLVCPWCHKTYMAGLILYPVAPGHKARIEAPPDVIPNAREQAALRLQAQGWYATHTYERGAPVNVAVTSPCSCPEKGWSATCPVHGDPATALYRGEM